VCRALSVSAERHDDDDDDDDKHSALLLLRYKTDDTNCCRWSRSLVRFVVRTFYVLSISRPFRARDRFNAYVFVGFFSRTVVGKRSCKRRHETANTKNRFRFRLDGYTARARNDLNDAQPLASDQ